MRRFVVVAVAALTMLVALLAACSNTTAELSNSEKLHQWRTGVWITGTGTYTVYTNDHYFVLSFEGDTASANLYFAASQLGFYERGMTRCQTVRLRQMPRNDLTLWRDSAFIRDNNEVRASVDTSLFNNKTCVLQDGVLYDAIIESTDTYILLATCNGDREKIFCDGRSVYMPAAGGEFWSYRVETL